MYFWHGAVEIRDLKKRAGFFFARKPPKSTRPKCRGNEFWPFGNEFWCFGNEFWCLGNEFWRYCRGILCFGNQLWLSMVKNALKTALFITYGAWFQHLIEKIRLKSLKNYLGNEFRCFRKWVLPFGKWVSTFWRKWVSVKTGKKMACPLIPFACQNRISSNQLSCLKWG